MENECDLYGCHTVDVDVKSPAQKTMAKSQDHDVLSKLSKLARALDQAKGAGSAEESKTQRLKEEMGKLEDKTASDASKLQDTRDLLHQEEREEEDEHIERLKAQDQIKQQNKELNKMTMEVRTEREDERVALHDMDKDRESIDSDGSILADTKKALLREKQAELQEQSKLQKAEAELSIYREHSQHEQEIISLQNKIMHIQAHDIEALEESAKKAMHSVQSALGSAVGHVGVQPELHTEEQELKKKGKGGGVAKTGSKWERKEKRMEEIRQKQLDAAHDWAAKREHPDMDQMTVDQKAADKALAGKQTAWEEESKAEGGKVAEKFGGKEARRDKIRQKQLQAAHSWGTKREGFSDPSDDLTQADKQYSQKQRDWMRAHPEERREGGARGKEGSQLDAVAAERKEEESEEREAAKEGAENGGKGAAKKGVEGEVGADISSLKHLLRERQVSGGEGKVIEGALGQAEGELKKLAVAKEEMQGGVQNHAEKPGKQAAPEQEQEQEQSSLRGAKISGGGGKEANLKTPAKMKARAEALAATGAEFGRGGWKEEMSLRKGEREKAGEREEARARAKEREGAEAEFEVQVPQGAKAGEDMQVHIPGGGLENVELPANVKAGTDVILVDASADQLGSVGGNRVGERSGSLRL